MIKLNKLKQLESKVFELEVRIGLMEASLNDFMLSEGMSVDIESGKWYHNDK